MKIFKYFKDFLYKCDFFYSTELLRYKTEPQYRTLFGGVLSLIIIIALLATFYNKLIDTMNKVIITSVSSNQNAAYPTPFKLSTFSQDNFMFAVQIFGHDFNSGPRYFDVTLANVVWVNGYPTDQSMNYPLESCTLEHWQAFPEIQKDYERINMKHWLCPKKNMKFNIQGKFTSSLFKYLEIALKKCSNESQPERPCASPQEIDQYFEIQKKVFLTVHFSNPLINPTSQEYITYYLEDNNFIIFNDKFGSTAILYMQEYQIETDQSILPFAQTHQDSGGIVTEFAVKHPFLFSGHLYSRFLFVKSSSTTQYQRNFQKIDSLLSYIGGLFGTIAIILFLANNYNGQSFEITLGSFLFKNKDQKQGDILKKHNFISFLLCGIYTLLDTFGCSPKWKTIKQYKDNQDQMVKQLDIRFLLKRIFFLEKVIKIFFEDHQWRALHLQEKITLQEAKIIRKDFKLKRRIFDHPITKNEQFQINSSTVNLNHLSQSFKLATKEKNTNLPQILTIKQQNFIKNQLSNQGQQEKKDSQQQLKKRKRQKLKKIQKSKEKSKEIQLLKNTLSKKTDSSLKVQDQKEEQSKEQDSEKDSDSSQSQHEVDFTDNFKKLKDEVKKGNELSRRIWRTIDKRIIKKLESLVKIQSYQSIDSQSIKAVDEIGESLQTEQLKINSYTEQKLLHGPSKALISGDWGLNHRNSSKDEEKLQKVDNLYYENRAKQFQPSNTLIFEDYQSDQINHQEPY